MSTIRGIGLNWNGIKESEFLYMNVFAIGCLSIGLAICGIVILVLAFIDERNNMK